MQVKLILFLFLVPGTCESIWFSFSSCVIVNLIRKLQDKDIFGRMHRFEKLCGIEKLCGSMCIKLYVLSGWECTGWSDQIRRINMVGMHRVQVKHAKVSTIHHDSPPSKESIYSSMTNIESLQFVQRNNIRTHCKYNSY